MEKREGQHKNYRVAIRQSRFSDFPLIVALDKRCFEPGIAYSPDEFLWLLEGPDIECKVAEVDGILAGFIIYHLREGSTGEIITIDIDEGYRRRKIGTRLLDLAETHLRAMDARNITLQVDTENTAAISFYQRTGYRVKKILKHYYRHRRDAYLMEKRLEE